MVTYGIAINRGVVVVDFSSIVRELHLLGVASTSSVTVGQFKGKPRGARGIVGKVNGLALTDSTRCVDTVGVAGRNGTYQDILERGSKVVLEDTVAGKTIGRTSARTGLIVSRRIRGPDIVQIMLGIHRDGGDEADHKGQNGKDTVSHLDRGF